MPQYRKEGRKKKEELREEIKDNEREERRKKEIIILDDLCILEMTFISDYKFLEKNCFIDGFLTQGTYK